MKNLGAAKNLGSWKLVMSPYVRLRKDEIYRFNEGTTRYQFYQGTKRYISISLRYDETSTSTKYDEISFCRWYSEISISNS